MTRIFNSKTECLNKVRHLKLLQNQWTLRPDVIPLALANSSQWIVWSYEAAGRKNGKFGVDKVPYQARNPSLKASRWDVSDWDDLATALQCVLTNPHIDGIGYFFSKNDGLIGIDFDNCRDPKTGRIRKEYQFWIDKLDGYTEVSPSGTGVKVWVKGIVDNRCFRNDESTGFRIPNFAGGIIEIYRRGQYFTVTTQVLDGFEHIKPAQEELDVLSEFYLSHTHNNLLGVLGGWVSGEQAPNVVENLPKSTKACLGTGYLTGKIAYSPDGTQLVVPKSTGIWVYDTSTFEVTDLISEHRAFNSTEIRNNQWCELIEVDNAVGFSSEGKLFAVRVAWQYCVLPRTSEIYTIRIWSREIEQPERISIECPEKIDSMMLSPDGTTLAGSKNGTIYLWNVHTGELQNILTVEAKKIDSMVFSPDRLTLASTSWVGTGQFGISPDGDTYESIHSFIDVWDIRTGRHKFIQHQATDFLVFSSDGRTLANSTEDGWFIALSDVETGIRKFCLEDYAYNSYYDGNTLIPIRATSLVFSPDVYVLASFSANKIQLWDLHTGNCKLTFTGTGDITSLVFSPDGLTLAGGCEDGTVLLWDIDSASDETTLTDDNPFIIPESNVDSGINEIIITEETAEFRNRASQICQFCAERGITTLCHFTRVENLQNILQEGLIGRSLLEEREQDFLFNDEDRADSNKEAVCLSISFPNYKMLWDIRKKKEKTKGITDSQWIVLLLDAKVLWELDCAFCQTNAASGAVIPLLSDDRIGEQKRLEALKDMFADNFYASKRKIWIRRQNLQIPEHYTTDPQAEVLVFDPISAKYIKEVHFYEETARKQWLSRNRSTHPQTFSSNRDYFYGRSDSAFWKKETP